MNNAHIARVYNWPNFTQIVNVPCSIYMSNTEHLYSAMFNGMGTDKPSQSDSNQTRFLTCHVSPLTPAGQIGSSYSHTGLLPFKPHAVFFLLLCEREERRLPLGRQQFFEDVFENWIALCGQCLDRAKVCNYILNFSECSVSMGGDSTKIRHLFNAY